MLQWALGFFLVAIIAAVLGFGGIAGAATDMARIAFFLFLVMFVLSFVAHLFRSGPRMPTP